MEIAEREVSGKIAESICYDREYYDEENTHCIVQDYVIDVEKSIEENRQKYEELICKEVSKKR